jgi:membrane-associated protease RseP (regulator of RpoE activity)
MRKALAVMVLVTGLMLGIVASAQAFEICISIPSNVFRLELTPTGNFFSIVGRERVFAERAVVGAGYLEPGGTAVRILLTEATTTVGAMYNVQLNLDGLTGPVNIARTDGSTGTGATATVVACTGSADPSPSSNGTDTATGQ